MRKMVRLNGARIDMHDKITIKCAHTYTDLTLNAHILGPNIKRTHTRTKHQTHTYTDLTSNTHIHGPNIKHTHTRT